MDLAERSGGGGFAFDRAEQLGQRSMQLALEHRLDVRKWRCRHLVLQRAEHVQRALRQQVCTRTEKLPHLDQEHAQLERGLTVSRQDLDQALDVRLCVGLAALAGTEDPSALAIDHPQRPQQEARHAREADNLRRQEETRGGGPAPGGGAAGPARGRGEVRRPAPARGGRAGGGAGSCSCSVWLGVVSRHGCHASRRCRCALSMRLSQYYGRPRPRGGSEHAGKRSSSSSPRPGCGPAPDAGAGAPGVVGGGQRLPPRPGDAGGAGGGGLRRGGLRPLPDRDAPADGVPLPGHRRDSHGLDGPRRRAAGGASGGYGTAPRLGFAAAARGPPPR